MDVRDLPVAEERNPHAAARGAEQYRPITFDLTIEQHIEADPLAVEAKALVKVTDDADRMMNPAGHGVRPRRTL
jgi:hypothetical protein